jgi:putative secretion ATPase (PEP-CTERM system associated)
MYSTYYKLRADPFRLSPDTRFCFPHRTYRKAMTYMRHALFRAEGFIVITGQPGMGKTTLINDMLRGLKPDLLRIARLVSTQLMADDLLRLVAYELDLDPTGMDKASVLKRVEHFLRQQHREGKRTLLVVDEAQDVTAEALEELRLLTNIQAGGQQLLQIFLVGQEELRDAVSAPTLVQLHQRVIAAAHIDPLNLYETKHYITHRLQRVGWEGNPLISNQAYVMIHQFSRGIPRQINQICSRLLLHGSIEERSHLGLQDLQIVIEELHAEMLLPQGMQEVADTVAWPEEPQQESYDETPRKRPRTQAKTANPPTGAAPPPADRGQPAARQHQKIAANSDGERPGNHSRPVSAAVGSGDNGMQKRKRGPMRLLAITVLLAGLLLALFIALDTDRARQLRDDLVALAASVYQPPPAPPTGMASTQQVNPAPSIRKPEATSHDVPADRHTPVEPAPQPAKTENAAEADPGEIEVATREPAAERLPLSQLESDLTGNGLHVERLADNSLKIKLSNEGMFEIDSTEISDSASESLKKLVDVLRKHDETGILVVGHTDSSGQEGFNLALSQVRAKAVADYLVSQGLPESYIRSEGRGDRETRFEKATRHYPKLRRRVEVYLRPLD